MIELTPSKSVCHTKQTFAPSLGYPWQKVVTVKNICPAPYISILLEHFHEFYKKNERCYLNSGVQE